MGDVAQPPQVDLRGIGENPIAFPPYRITLSSECFGALS